MSVQLGLIPEKIRASALIKFLAIEVRKETTSGFHYFTKLAELEELVRPQLTWIPHLFPEYTPHDFEGHVLRLFRIADVILGEDLYERLNAAELFLLIAGLYAHDWGMAVGPAEQRALKLGGAGTDQAAGYILLPNEKETLRNFCLERGLKVDESGTIEMADAQLAEYVRRTHASRSGVRVREWLAACDPALAEALQFVCAGHWLDVREIRRDHDERQLHSILHQRVSRSAAAVYVRLVDLFDIARDRTPQSLAEFVRPVGGRSLEEWQKHNALNPVTARPGTRREIEIQGQTDDPATWALLRDLQRYVDAEFTTCVRFVRHHLEQRYHLSVEANVHWDIQHIGFRPIDLRFEFQRNRMFQILSEEIYESDPYVFLRELLQNSIDALRMRRALQARHQPGAPFTPLIRFEVEYGDNGNALIQCIDNGVGMDEFVLQEYLAKVGVTYCDSVDFLREDVNVDFIARFGLGFLSCFMVADRVEIRTCRYAPPGKSSDNLHVVIADVGQQFAVYEETSSHEFGTRVYVYAQGKKLGRRSLDVGAYLKTIAGFVEFPIFVRETRSGTKGANGSERHLLILHPDAPPDSVVGAVPDEVEIHQLFRGVNAGYLTKAQYLDSFRQHWKLIALELGNDLALEDCEGFVVAFTLKNEASFCLKFNDPKTYEAGRVIHDPDFPERCFIAFYSTPFGYAQARYGEGLSASAARGSNWAIYVDGILIPETTPPPRWDDSDALIPLPNIWLNIKRQPPPKVKVSRFSLVEDERDWYDAIWEALIRFATAQAAADSGTGPILKRATHLAVRSQELGLTVADHTIVARAILPSALAVDSRGNIGLQRIDPNSAEEWFIVPTVLADDLYRRFEEFLFDSSQLSRTRVNWQGPMSILQRKHLPTAHDEEGRAIICEYLTSVWIDLERGLVARRIQFLTPASYEMPPLVQIVATPASDAEKNQTGNRRERNLNTISEPWLYNGPMEIPFSAPFQDLFGYGRSYWNSLHPTTQALRNATAAIFRAIGDDPENAELEKLKALLNAAQEPLCRRGVKVTVASMLGWRQFWKAFVSSQLLTDISIPDFPLFTDYVPNTRIGNAGTFRLYKLRYHMNTRFKEGVVLDTRSVGGLAVTGPAIVAVL